jgi:hypothetical protein
MDVLVYLRGVCIICFNRRKVDFGQVYNNRAYRLRRRLRLVRGGMHKSQQEPFRPWICHASADFAHRRMTHRSLGVGGYGFWGPRV